MYCKFCGKPTGSSAVVCAECQAKLGQPATPTVQETAKPIEVTPTLPVKTGATVALSVISKILIVLAFVGAVASFLTITTIVLMYNMQYGFQTISHSQLSALLATAELYKGYAITIIFIALSSIVLAIPALVMAKINKSKGFPSKLVKIFFILTIVFGSIAIANCALNYFLLADTKYFTFN